MKVLTKRVIAAAGFAVVLAAGAFAQVTNCPGDPTVPATNCAGGTARLSVEVSLYIDEKLVHPALKLDLPLFDFPYQIETMNTVGHGFFSSYANPSMSQSLALTADLYSGFHFGMKKFYDSSKMNKYLTRVIYNWGTIAGDLLMMWMPGGDGWLHEEYHRAVMSHYGVNSFNGMNHFPIGANLIYVSNVKDEDLIRLKKESPADMVRLHSAGIESDYALINNLQRNNFFYDQNLLHEILYVMLTVNSHYYIFASSSPNWVDKEIPKRNEIEKTVSERDFTGYDMTAWAYDLFRPDEPYEARGPHPSGVGINRYRTTQDLTNDELKYLKNRFYWHSINYLSPMLFGLRSVSLGNSELTGNFAMRHLLTSFGTDVSAQVFLKYKPFNMAFAYHSYLNYDHYFPAIEAELVDYPLYFGEFGIFLSPRIIMGLQPENQKFKTGNPEFLGLFGLRADFTVNKYFLPFIALTAKTDGWVAGNEYLDSNISVEIGVSARF
jgi:hypothetical protein